MPVQERVPRKVPMLGGAAWHLRDCRVADADLVAPKGSGECRDSPRSIMAVEPAVFVPPIVVAHVLGFVLLLYSIEKVSGVISKTVLRRRRSSPVESPTRKALPRSALDSNRPIGVSAAGQEEDVGQGAQEHRDWDSSLEARAMTHAAPDMPHMLTAPWVRGCACQVRRLHAPSWPVCQGCAGTASCAGCSRRAGQCPVCEQWCE